MPSKPSRSRHALQAGLLLTAALVPSLALAQPPYLVRDLNTVPVNGSSQPLPYDYFGPQRAEMGGVLYFAAADPMHGQELWRSDGTPGGTRLVRDLRPGTVGSNPFALTVHQGRLYFFADDGVRGAEVWSSDGSREGTRLVRDVCPGSCSVSFEGSMASAGSQLFFTAGVYPDFELWRTDGTREGTRRVVDPCPGCFYSPLQELTSLPGGRVVFAALHPEKGIELWVSDGTPQGTFAFDLVPGRGGSYPTQMIALGNRVLFWALYQGGYDLWETDGTLAGTRIVRPGTPVPSYQGGPVVWKGVVYLGSEAGELWRTDGTSGGTFPLASFQPGSPYQTPYSPGRLTPLRDSLLFVAGDSVHGMALWRTFGTPETTQLLKDPVPGPDSPEVLGLQRSGDRATFLTRSPEGLIDLWGSDGSALGTRRVAAVCRDGEECLHPDRRDFTAAGNLTFFTVHSTRIGSELWRSDGSAAGTFLVRDIHKGAGSAGLFEIASLNGRALFGGWTRPPNPATLWSSDGTAAGTVEVSGGVPWPQSFKRQGDHLYFSGAEMWGSPPLFHLHKLGLWRTDGTPAGTERIWDLVDLDLLTLDGDLLYLRAADRTEPYDDRKGVELWRSDGTPGGTRQVVDLDQQWVFDDIGSPPIQEPGSSDPGPLVRLGAALLFAADDGLTGRQLWATDGTEAGTHKVRQINSHVINDGEHDVPASADPDFLVRLGGAVLFAADDGLSGRELWVTNGTEAGTRLLRDLRPGALGSAPHDLVELGGKAYFFATANGASEDLWQTDGTAAGTVRVKSLAVQGLPSWGRKLTRAGSQLFFVVDNESAGPELYVSNGTAAGTRLVRQIRPGPNGSYPQAFTVVGSVLVFAADDGAHGLEPWRSDGTAAGTYLLRDVAPGPAASSPSAFAAAGPLLFFGADDGMHGRELWAMGWPPR
jgi:ELWxxDGT repeat protein